MITTINAEELRQLGACEKGYNTFIAAHGEATVSLVDALDSNGIHDGCWLLGKIDLNKQQERDLRLLAADYAERVLHIYENVYPDDSGPRAAIQAARKYADGECTKEGLEEAARAAARAAGEAARAAGEAAGESARAAGEAARDAGEAAWDAGEAAARAAGEAARAAAMAAGESAWDAGEAAWDAARAEREYQQDMLRNILVKWCKDE